MDLEMIVPVAFDWDLDGDIDLIVGDEDGRVALVENVGGQPAASAGLSPRFAKPRYFQQEADTLKCGALASPYPLIGMRMGISIFFQATRRAISNGLKTFQAKALAIRSGTRPVSSMWMGSHFE